MNLVSLQNIKASGLSTLSECAVLLCLDKPKTINQVVLEANVSRRMVERFVLRAPDLINVDAFNGKLQAKTKPYQIQLTRTAKANKLIKQFK